MCNALVVVTAVRPAPAPWPSVCVSVRCACCKQTACCFMLQVVRSHKSMVARAAASAKKVDGRSSSVAEGAPKHAKKAGSGEKKRKASRQEQPAEQTKPAKPAVSKPQKKQKTPVGAAHGDSFVPCTASPVIWSVVIPTSCVQHLAAEHSRHLLCRRGQDHVLGCAEEAGEDEVHLRHGWHQVRLQPLPDALYAYASSRASEQNS